MIKRGSPFNNGMVDTPFYDRYIVSNRCGRDCQTKLSNTHLTLVTECTYTTRSYASLLTPPPPPSPLGSRRHKQDFHRHNLRLCESSPDHCVVFLAIHTCVERYFGATYEEGHFGMTSQASRETAQSSKRPAPAIKATAAPSRGEDMAEDYAGVDEHIPLSLVRRRCIRGQLQALVVHCTHSTR
jgi:hypothetical protein